MSQFAIVTDACAELLVSLAQENDVEILPMKFTLGDRVYTHYADYREMDAKLFYDKLRAGETITTSAINTADYTEALTPILEAGRDVLLLVFSSGLSSTYQSSLIAVEELREQFPDRKIFTVDTLAPSGGEALLVWHAAQLRKAGKAIEEVRDWVEENKLHMAHWFTVDDLHFLKRGGRVSAATAVVGSMLQIKPVMHVDDEGHLINMAKARGRSASLKALVDHMQETAIDPGEQVVFISHGDCEEEAMQVAEDVKRRFGTKVVRLNNCGPVVGGHSGPGTMALFFLGTKR